MQLIAQLFPSFLLNDLQPFQEWLKQQSFHELSSALNPVQTTDCEASAECTTSTDSSDDSEGKLKIFKFKQLSIHEHYIIFSII